MGVTPLAPQPRSVTKAAMPPEKEQEESPPFWRADHEKEERSRQELAATIVSKENAARNHEDQPWRGIARRYKMERHG
jgi:hypothetical protein